MFVEATSFDSTLASSKPYIHSFTKSTKASDQDQKILFSLNQCPNDHGSIDLSQRIKSILGMIN